MAESTRIAELLRELHREAGWENASGARRHAEAIARVGGDEAVVALIGVLEQMAAVDLSDDAGDVSDECWRASTAAVHGLVMLGGVAVARLRAVVNGPASRARAYAGEALSMIGDG